MTLLERTYTQLRLAGLTHCAQAFSCDYLGKSKNWYAFQTYAGRDFSAAAAIQCLRSLRLRQLAPQLHQQQRDALVTAEQALLAHLNQVHLVADVL